MTIGWIDDEQWNDVGGPIRKHELELAARQMRDRHEVDSAGNAQASDLCRQHCAGIVQRDSRPRIDLVEFVTPAHPVRDAVVAEVKVGDDAMAPILEI